MRGATKGSNEDQAAIGGAILGVGEGLDIGTDRKLPVSVRYDGGGAWPYTGRVASVTIEPGAHPSDSYANLPERTAQRERAK